jgi:DNA repair exonuclease SbcCD nuclease subunit
MPLARFLQVSDFHLGRAFGWLAAERRKERRYEQRRALEEAVRLAIERGTHAILLPGDLFDVEAVDADTMSFALHAFRVAGCPPVFVAPGNHDPASPTSHAWNPALLRARGFAWPGHVHVFTEPEWTALPLPGLEGVTVWGRCFASGMPSAERPLEPGTLRGVAADDGVHVAVFHGSREGFCPPRQAVTAPFSDDEALRSRFAYMAVGHYHAASQLRGPEGVRLAYAGSAVALDMSETGPHGALEVRITTGQGLPRTETEFLELDRRRVYDLGADVSGCGSAEQVDRRALKAMDQAGASEQDITTVRFSGRLARGVRYSGPGPELEGHAFHVRVDLSRVRPDYDLDALRRDASDVTEMRFARALLERLDAEKDPGERALLESALYYGLDAFRLGEVAPAYEELAE